VPASWVQDNLWCSQGVATRYVPPAAHALIGELDDPNGAGLDGTDVVQNAVDRLGQVPAVYSFYLLWQDPSDPGWDDWGFLSTLADEVSQKGGILALTMDLQGGLPPFTPRINPTSVADLVARLNIINTIQGVPVLLRIGPEMNGDWNVAWSQTPVEYTQAFRTIADAVHAGAPATQTVWSPAYASGFPWGAPVHQVADADGQRKYETEAEYAADTAHHPPLTAAQAAADFAALDTNGDHVWDNKDDPYAPFYPEDLDGTGRPALDTAVDWVGMSIYHFGIRYPWGDDTLALPHEFDRELLGTFAFPGDVNQETTSDFYDDYSGSGVQRDGTAGHGKPMMVSETGSWYDAATDDLAKYPDTANTPIPGHTEYDVKKTWWDEIKAALPALPQIRAVVFFDATQDPAAVTSASRATGSGDLVGSVVDWRFDTTPELVAAFNAEWPASQGFLYATGGPCFAGGVGIGQGPPVVAAPVSPPGPVSPVNPVVAAPGPAGVLTTMTFCTSRRTTTVSQGDRDVRTTTLCSVDLVRASWVIGRVCATHRTVIHPKGGKAVRRVRHTCRPGPVRHITVVKVVRHIKKVTTT
jgi:hypothetical protein